MVQLNPILVFGAKKKYQYHLTEISVQTVSAQGKNSIPTGMVWDTNMAAVLLF